MSPPEDFAEDATYSFRSYFELPTILTKSWQNLATATQRHV